MEQRINTDPPTEVAPTDIGEPQSDACKGCFMTEPPSGLSLPEVGRGYLRFNHKIFVKECPQELPEELTGPKRLEACKERIPKEALKLRDAKIRSHEGRLEERRNKGFGNFFRRIIGQI